MPDFRLLKSREFAAAQPVELTTVLRPNTGSPFRLTPVAQVNLGSLQAGDVIDIASCCAQVSSKIPHWLMVGSHLILCDSPRTSAAFTQNDFGRWTEITEAMTTNIVNTIHHHAIRTSGRYVVTEDWDSAYLTFLLYAAFPDWDGKEALVVDRDFGRLEGAVHRPVTREELLEFLGIGGTAPPAPTPAPPPALSEGTVVALTPEEVTAVQSIAARLE